MIKKRTCLIAIPVIFLVSSKLHAEDTGIQAYALMQDCLAEAMDVVDNGSYERFCIERYLVIRAEQKEYLGQDTGLLAPYAK